MSRQYVSAAKAVDAVDCGRQSFKSYCGTSGKIGKVDFALAAETMKFASVLEDIFKRAGVSSTSLDVGSGMLKVMSYELLFGKKKISGGGAVKRAIMDVKDKMVQALESLMLAKGVSDYRELLSKEVTEASKMPKYVRINEIKLSSLEEGLAVIRKICPEAAMDSIIPALVVIPPGKSLGEHPYVKDGKFIIQDKASCFPSQCLYDAWCESKVGDVIDACAAPGNKTSHVAALLGRHGKSGNKSKIFAFDKNPQRAELLQQRMDSAGASGIVKVSNEDFLEVDVTDQKYKSVSCVLLDPSCSGSGVARVLERVVERGENGDGNKTVQATVDNRLLKLRTFQLAALRKAMSFPSVQFVVYSTCSIHKEENESVVVEALSRDSSPIDSPQSSSCWTLIEPLRMKDWTRRGESFEGLPLELQNKLIRCHPSDGLNGFFVAVFRKQSTSSACVENSSENSSLSTGLIDSTVALPPTVNISQDTAKIYRKRKAPLDSAIGPRASAENNCDSHLNRCRDVTNKKGCKCVSKRSRPKPLWISASFCQRR